MFFPGSPAIDLIGGFLPPPNNPPFTTTPSPTPPNTPLYTNYVSDIDYLRNMPVNIPASWQQYANIAEQMGQYLTQTPTGAFYPQYQYIQEAQGAKAPISEYGQFYTELLGQQIPQLQGSPTYQQLQSMFQANIGRLSQLPSSLEQQYRQHIQYLSDIPGLSAIDAPYLTTAYENIDRTYDAARQRLLQEYARRGIEPSSGIVQSELRKIEEARAADKAKAQRDLAMWQIQEQRSRLAEARGLEAALEQLERVRTSGAQQLMSALEQLERARLAETRGVAGLLSEAGIGNIIQQLALQQQAGVAAQALENWLTGRALQALPIFQQIPQITQALDQLERSRRAEARGIESAMEEIERQRIMDMLALLSGTMPPAGGIGAAGGMAGMASQLAALLGQQAAGSWSALGQMIGQLIPIFTQQPQPQPQPQVVTTTTPKVFTGSKQIFPW